MGNKEKDLFGTFDDDVWDDAIEAWGETIASEEDDVEDALLRKSTNDSVSLEDVDPMIALVSPGEIEIKEEQGAALGTLLGSADENEETQNPNELQDVERMDSVEDIVPYDVSAESVDIELSAVESVAAVEERKAESVEVYSEDELVDILEEEGLKRAQKIENKERRLRPLTGPIKEYLTADIIAEQSINSFDPPVIPEDPEELDQERVHRKPTSKGEVAVRPELENSSDDTQQALAKVALRKVRKPAAAVERIRKMKTPANDLHAVSLDVFDELVPNVHDPEISASAEMFPEPKATKETEPEEGVFQRAERLLGSTENVLPIIPADFYEVEFDEEYTLDVEPADQEKVDSQTNLKAVLNHAAENSDSASSLADLALYDAILDEPKLSSDEALKKYREVLSHRPNDVVALHSIWRIQRQQDNEEHISTLKVLEELYREDAKPAIASLGLSLNYKELDEVLDSQEEIGEWAEQFGPLARAEVFAFSDRWAEAEESLCQWQTEKENDVHVAQQTLKAKRLEFDGKYIEAEGVYQSLMSKSSLSYDVERVFCADMSGEDKECFQAMSKSKTLFSHAHRLRARIHALNISKEDTVLDLDELQLFELERLFYLGEGRRFAGEKDYLLRLVNSDLEPSLRAYFASLQILIYLKKEQNKEAKQLAIANIDSLGYDYAYLRDEFESNLDEKQYVEERYEKLKKTCEDDSFNAWDAVELSDLAIWMDGDETQQLTNLEKAKKRGLDDFVQDELARSYYRSGSSDFVSFVAENESVSNALAVLALLEKKEEDKQYIDVYRHLFKKESHCPLSLIHSLKTTADKDAIKEVILTFDEELSHCDKTLWSFLYFADVLSNNEDEDIEALVGPLYQAVASRIPWARWSYARLSKNRRTANKLDFYCQQMMPDTVPGSGKSLELGICFEAAGDLKRAKEYYEGLIEAGKDDVFACQRLVLLVDEDQRGPLYEKMLDLCQTSELRLTLLFAIARLKQMNDVGYESICQEIGDLSASSKLAEVFAGERSIENAVVSYKTKKAFYQHLSTITQGKARNMYLEALARLEAIQGDHLSTEENWKTLYSNDPTHVGALRALEKLDTDPSKTDLEGAIIEAEASGSDGLALFLIAALKAVKNKKNDALRLAMKAVLDIDATSYIGDQIIFSDSGNELLDFHKEQRKKRAEYALLNGSSADLCAYSAWMTLVEESGGEQEKIIENCPSNLLAIYAMRDDAFSKGNWKQSLWIIDREIEQTIDSKLRCDTLIIAGDLALKRLKNNELAIDYYQKAFSIDPGRIYAFKCLVELLEEAERWQELAKNLEERSVVANDPKEQTELHRKMARIARNKLHDVKRSKEELLKILNSDPQDKESLEQLARIYEESEEWGKSADLWIRRARLENDKGKLRDILLRLGRIYQEDAQDSKRALLSLKKVEVLDPKNIEALERLSELYYEDGDYEEALKATQKVLELQNDPARIIDHTLRLATIYEEGFRDYHMAAKTFRQALEFSPSDLKAIGALSGFYARQSDQRSVMIHLDRSVTIMRERLEEDPYEAFAYQALYKIFGWRKQPDACLCAANVLVALGESDSKIVNLVNGHEKYVGKATKLGSSEIDEWVFMRVIPSGFRHIFRALHDSLNKVFKGDLKKHGLTRSDRITTKTHPLKLIADEVFRDFEVKDFDLYLSKDHSMEIAVENTSTPSIILGKALVKGATESEMRFVLARCAWLVRKAMILPVRFYQQLDLLVAGVVRQYVKDFKPPGFDEKELKEITKQVSRAIPRRLRQELEVFALECHGDIDLSVLGPAVIHSANRAGVLACGSIQAAVNVLRKIDGKMQESLPVIEAIEDNAEIEELLRFMVSDDHFQVRRSLGIALQAQKGTSG